MNSLKYKELRTWFLDNEEAKKLAKEVFGDCQPSIYQTGFYSSPSWNWGYIIGIAKDNLSGDIYEVVAQFGQIKDARKVWL